MSNYLPHIVALAATFTFVSAQSTFPATPLASKTFAYPTGIPYKVDTDVGLVRGTQKGYNICNSTTENQHSLCQTSIFNTLDDFCLWAPAEPNSVVGNIEGEMIAWCTKPGHGTRLIPGGALTGLQYMKTPDYIQIVGFLDQTKVDIQAGDYGGEMDPHGADLRGNPMGGIVYSNAWTGSYLQVMEWHNFIGSDAFCFKACDPRGPNAAHFCEHIFDRIGCAYNAPNNAKPGVFESCEGDNQDFPGIYTENGQVKTYTQPAESLGPISTMPYQPKVPASSNCKTFESSSIFAALATVSADPQATGGATSSSAAATSSGLSSKASTTPSATGSSAPAKTSSSDANTLAITGVSIIGVVFSALFLS